MSDAISIPQLVDLLRNMDESDVLKVDFIALIKLSAMVYGEDRFIKDLIRAADDSDDASLRRKIGAVLLNGFGFFGSDEALKAANRLSKSKDKRGFFASLFGRKNSESNIAKVEKSTPKPPDTIEVPNIWGEGDGKPFVILRHPDIDAVFNAVSHSDFKTTVTAYLGHPEPKIRIATLNQIITRRTGAYNQRIIDVLADTDAEVRVAAAKALWTDIEAVEFAIACLRDEARGYNSFGTATFSTMSPEQAEAGIEILRKTAPNSADLARFEEIYDEVWNAEKREEEERATVRAKQDKIEEIKKSLSLVELEELMSSMSDIEKKFNIGDIFLNQKIEEKYLNKQVSKTEDNLPAEETILPVSSPVNMPGQMEHVEADSITKPHAKEILCPYCNTHVTPDEVAGKLYCPNDGRELPTSTVHVNETHSESSVTVAPKQVICPYCEAEIIPHEISGKLYCPNDGRLLPR